MRYVAPVVSALVVLAAAVPAQAATLGFAFGFVNDANGGGITGEILGLEDNATSAPTSVKILSNENGFGLGEYFSPNLADLSFTVADGTIVWDNFSSEGKSNQPPTVTCCTLTLQFFNNSTSLWAGLTNAPGEGALLKRQ